MHKLHGNFLLHHRAIDDLRRGGVVLGDGRAPRAAFPGGKSAEHQRPLSHGINLAIGAQQRRLEQHAAGERLGVAHGSHRHIQPRAALEETGEYPR